MLSFYSLELRLWDLVSTANLWSCWCNYDLRHQVAVKHCFDILNIVSHGWTSNFLCWGHIAWSCCVEYITPSSPRLSPETPNKNNNNNKSNQPRTLPRCLGLSPAVFLFSPAWKQNKAEAGGTPIGIGTLHIVPRASSSTFLGWLGSGPPVQEYCSNAAAPGTWPQLTTAASTDHCGAEAGWWLSLPHQSSFSHLFWLI